MSAYGAIAKVYDLFLDDFNYRHYTEYIRNIVKEHNYTGSIVDAGCGTGTMLKLLSGVKNELIGIDLSTDMLSIAARKNKNVLLLNQDITKMELTSSVSVVYSTLDVINHLPSLDEIKKFFRCVSLTLEEEGTFVFDFNLPYKHEYILANNSFTYEKYKYYLIWNSYLNKDRIKICLDLFTKEKDGRYLRESEEFFEYTYSLDKILSCLKDDFDVVYITDGDNFNELTEISERALITVRRKSHGEK